MTEHSLKYSRGTSFIIVTVGYVIAVAIAIMVMDIFADKYGPIINAAIGDFVATVVIFIFSVRLKNSSMYDAYWSVIPPLIAIYFMIELPDGNLMRQLLITSVVSFWAIRLTLNWAKGWPGLHHEDWRYTKLAEDTGKAYWLVSFLGIHLFPTVLVFLGCIPMYYAMASSAPIGVWDVVAALVAIIATIIEYVSDEQLRAFKSRVSEGTSSIMDSGIWAYSRHPNYFGEVLFWCGVMIFALGIDYQEYLWTGSGFLAMVILFQFISIPMMEKRHRAKRPEYDDYVRRVSRLVPWIPKDRIN